MNLLSPLPFLVTQLCNSHPPNHFVSYQPYIHSTKTIALSLCLIHKMLYIHINIQTLALLQHCTQFTTTSPNKMKLLNMFSMILTCLVHFGSPFTVIMPDPAPVDDTTLQNGPRTDPTEQRAVYDVMSATGNEWATQIPDVCRGRWHGIECSAGKDGVYHVVSLSFGALSDDTAFPTCDLNRSCISPSVTELPHLRTLFYYRCFTYNPQPIPGFLGRLGATLQTLVLRENGHTSPIPGELGNLTRLKSLDLHGNGLDGSIPVSLGRLSNLRSLDLSANRLTGPIPDFSLPNLNVLNMYQNHLTGPIPRSISLCRSLIQLDLSHNRLSGQIPDSITHVTDLILMDLGHNRLSGPIPNTLQKLTSLQALILGGNPLDCALPDEAFANLTSLTILVLTNAGLAGAIPDSIGRVGTLRTLRLDNNRLSGSIPQSFKGLREIGELRLNDNRLEGEIPIGDDIVRKLGRRLRIHDNLGLCWDLDMSHDVDDYGVGECKKGEEGFGSIDRTVQHVDVDDETSSMEDVVHVSSSSKVGSVGISLFVHLMALLISMYLVE